MLSTLTPTPLPYRMAPSPRRANTVGSCPRRSVAKRRMSAVWEEDEGPAGVDRDDPSLPQPAPTRSRPPKAAGDRTAYTQPSRAHTISGSGSVGSTLSLPRAAWPAAGRSARSSMTSVVSSSFTTSPRTVELPVPLPVSDGGAPSGFTSLVLPRAAYTPTSSKRYSAVFGGGGDTVDITRSGLSQTTMSTISIIKNAASASFGSRPRLLSLSSFMTSPREKHDARPMDFPASKSVTMLSEPLPLAFTSHTPPPSKVTSQQVLIQVYAVGLDHLDDLIVNEKVARNENSYGFVPGRSFVGRVVECGYEVNYISKSDWVMGLLDVRKVCPRSHTEIRDLSYLSHTYFVVAGQCGALSEFIVVDKRRLCVCPRPSPTLTLEQLALLPLCGIPSHRAVRTFELIQRGAKALVLEGHEGAGALAVQELAAQGVLVTAQIPPNMSSDNEKNELVIRMTEERVRRWGAKEVKVDTPLAAVNALHESEFDFVVDTVGGRRMWDACRRVLHTTGQFTTLVGESAQAIPSINAHFKSNLRSIQRAFVKKDHKSLGYVWVSPALDLDNEGEDIRDSLVSITKLAGSGVLVPWVDSTRTVHFERAPNIFSSGEHSTLSEGRTAVVRIVD